MEAPHSAIYFGDSRDHWWHQDFIALMARRLELARYHRVLDVGCGYGHWARVWLPHLARGIELVGIDPEARSIAQAELRNAAFIASNGLEVKASYLLATAEQLPFADGSFDLVTAQTVLIHVADVAPAITELHRVLRPGGLLLLAEPNNLAEMVCRFADRPDQDPALMLTALELEMRIERGKYLLGEGYNSAGEYLPRWLDQARFSRVRAWMCDRSFGLRPPYDSPKDQAEIAELREFHNKGWYGRPTDEARRYYLAGGGTEASFERAWAAMLAHEGRRLEAIDQGTLASAGGSVFHLFAAEKR